MKDELLECCDRWYQKLQRGKKSWKIAPHLRVKPGVPVPVDVILVPDPTRKTPTCTRPVPAGTGRVRVYPRVRVDPHTSSPLATRTKIRSVPSLNSPPYNSCHCEAASAASR